MELAVTDDTTALSYWLNRRVLLCSTSMVVALLMICKYEGSDHLKSDQGESQQEVNMDLCGDEAWRPCLKVIHPLWLLDYRVIAFSMLLPTLIAKVVLSGGGIFYYYTQWTFTLLTIYFGCGSLLSIYGCFWYNKTRSMGLGVHHVGSEAENGTYIPLEHEEKGSNYQEENYVLPMKAGAAMLTDCIYWLIIYPFLTIKDYNLSFITVTMHTVNAVLLLGDALLNCLQVPLVRISLFVLWTGIFVIFQWTIHAFVSLWWPYPFLDLSSPYSPVWYLLVALMHMPCYAFFTLIVRSKHYLLSKWFPVLSMLRRGDMVSLVLLMNSQRDIRFLLLQAESSQFNFIKASTLLNILGYSKCKA